MSVSAVRLFAVWLFIAWLGGAGAFKGIQQRVPLWTRGAGASVRLAAAEGDLPAAPHVVRLKTPPSTEALLARKQGLTPVESAAAPVESEMANAGDAGSLNALAIQPAAPSNPLLAKWKDFSTQRPIAGPALIAGAIWGGLSVYSLTERKMKAYHERQLKNIEHYGLEMIRYTGQFDTLKEVHEDHAKQLGPGHKKRSFFASYLALALGKMSICGASLQELAFVVTLNKLTETEVAETFVEVAEAGGTSLMASKVLFLAERLVESPEALEILRPVRKQLMDRFQGNSELGQMAQEELALTALDFFVRQEPSYDLRVEEGRLLGFTDAQIEAQIAKTQADIAEEEEALQAAEAEKQAAKDAEAAKRLAALQDAAREGFPAQEDEPSKGAGVALPGAKSGFDANSPGAGSGALVATCGNCGYKLFVAKGREERQFGDDFKCPQCGSPKSQFTQERR